MPRYFFDICNAQVRPDDEGSLLADDKAASVQAILFAAEYLKDHPALVEDGKRMEIQVMDEGRSAIFSVVVQTYGLAA